MEFRRLSNAVFQRRKFFRELKLVLRLIEFSCLSRFLDKLYLRILSRDKLFFTLLANLKSLNCPVSGFSFLNLLVFQRRKGQENILEVLIFCCNVTHRNHCRDGVHVRQLYQSKTKIQNLFCYYGQPSNNLQIKLKPFSGCD